MTDTLRDLIDEAHSTGWYQGQIESGALNDDKKAAYEILNQETILRRTRHHQNALAELEAANKRIEKLKKAGNDLYLFTCGELHGTKHTSILEAWLAALESTDA